MKSKSGKLNGKLIQKVEGSPEDHRDPIIFTDLHKNILIPSVQCKINYI